MYKIPRIVQPLNDELLASWVLRLTSENGFDSVRRFLDAYLYPNDTISVSFQKKMDFRIPFEYFWRALPHDSIDERSLFFQTSTFTCEAPLFTQEQRQRYINQSFNTNKTLEPLFPSPHGTLESLFICPECAKSELANKGFFIFHRAHHLPGVKVCYIHGCALGRVHENFLQLNSSRIPDFELLNVPKGDWAINYARFAKLFLDAEFDCSISDIILPIRERLTESVVKKIESEGIDNLSAQEVKKLLTGNVMYLSHKSVLAALYYLFNDVDSFRSTLSHVDIPTIQFTSEDYELVGAYRRDLIVIKHKLCGETTCTSPYGFKIGWRCASCDRGTSLQEKYRSLVTAVGDYSYEPVSDFQSMDKEIELLHDKCGRRSTFKARAFLYEGVRCICQRRILYEDAKRAVEQYEGFSLISYDRTDRPVRIKHSCGGTFEIILNKFFEKPFCRVCERKGHLSIRTTEDFKQDMKDLVGSEYSLIDNYNGPHAYLLIKHNVCGNIQKYRPFYFLDGGRCRFCHKDTSEEEFKTYVYRYSKGRYSVPRKATKNLFEVIDNTTGQKLRLSKLRILQDLHRPTISPVLPLDEKNEGILIREDRRSERFLAWLHENYKNEPIFSEDIQFEEMSLAEKQYTLANLETRGKLVRISVGVYGFPEIEYTKESVFVAKYLFRHGNHIGFYRGKQLAYMLGLTDTQPELSIATNKESAKTSARKIMFLGVPIHIKGVSESISNDNYLILEALDFLVQYKQCTKRSEDEVLAALRNHIVEANNGLMLPYSAFEPYLASYQAANIKTMMVRLLSTLCGNNGVE